MATAYHLQGLIRFDYLPVWFMVGLIFERIHRALDQYIPDCLHLLSINISQRLRILALICAPYLPRRPNVFSILAVSFMHRLRQGGIKEMRFRKSIAGKGLRRCPGLLRRSRSFSKGNGRSVFAQPSSSCELGMGEGRLITTMAAKFPEVNWH